MADEDLIEVLTRVTAIVESAKVPEDLRAEAFRAVWQSMTASAIPHGEHGLTHSVIDTQLDPGGNRWQELGARVGVPPDDLREVYDAKEDGTFSVQVPMSALPRTKTDGTRAVALLVCAGRQGIVEEWTTGEVIRDVCKHYGTFDSANNAAAMAQGDTLWQIDGSGANRKYKLRRAGWEAAAQLIAQIATG